MELAAFDFTAIYHPEQENCASDTFLRAIAATAYLPKLMQLKDLHESLRHSGVTKLAHNVQLS